jgi:transposase
MLPGFWDPAVDIAIAGVEGTSSYGAGLTRVLQAAGVEVAESAVRIARRVALVRMSAHPQTRD